MTPRDLDDVGAEGVTSDPLRPVRVDHPVVAADHGSTTDRGEFGQHERHGARVISLRSKTVEGGLRSPFVTVGKHQCSSAIWIDLCRSGFRIRFGQTGVESRNHHVGPGYLIEYALVDCWN